MRIAPHARLPRHTPLVATLVVVALAGAACGSPSEPAASGTPPGTPLSTPALKLAVLDAVGPLSYCDPDQYPLSRDPAQAAEGRLPTIQADTETYNAILKHQGIPPG